MFKLLGFLFLLFITGCFSGGDSPSPVPVNPVCPTTTAEISECNATITPGTSPVTVTGTAQFFKRTTTLYNGKLILGIPIPAALPIKFAEVRVLNTTGTVVQCGTTNATGLLKAVDGSPLLIPNTAGTYTVSVLSRGNHAMDVSAVPTKPAFQLYASVKKDNCSNVLHSISASVTTTGVGATISTSPAAIIAYARESESASAIQGAAFNIYNNLVTTYEYLATNTGTVNISCLNPKLHVYWQAGFNPAQYIYPDQDPTTVENISFYLRGYNELYINGGKIGNVTTADTDHFDDAVILHELGHRLEDACGKMDSPGGKHNGLFRIDPRLAWSEGWGNFIGAHIIKNNLAAINPDPALLTILGTPGWVYYLDTTGYKDGVDFNPPAKELIRLDLTKAGNNPESFISLGQTYYYDKVDSTLNPGEGHFREVSIARSLFKTTNTCASGCTNHSDYFDEVWKSMDKLTGMGQIIYSFRSSVRFYNLLKTNFGGTLPASIDVTLNSDEAQQRDGNASYTNLGNLTWPPYGIKLVPSGTVCTFEIRPKNEDATVTNILSDQRYSNHYFYIDKSTSVPSISQLTLNTVYVAGTTPVSFGLRLYPGGYAFESSTAQYSSSIDVSAISVTTPYLLNVRAFTTGVTIDPSTRYTYTITTTPGGYLCPAPTF